MILGSLSVTKANGFLHNITSFQFLVAASIAVKFLHGVTIKLHKRSIDILSAYEQFQTVHIELKENCDEEFHTWFEEISKLAQELNISMLFLAQ